MVGRQRRVARREPQYEQRRRHCIRMTHAQRFPRRKKKKNWRSTRIGGQGRNAKSGLTTRYSSQKGSKMKKQSRLEDFIVYMPDRVTNDRWSNGNRFPMKFFSLEKRFIYPFFLQLRNVFVYPRGVGGGSGYFYLRKYERCGDFFSSLCGRRPCLLLRNPISTSSEPLSSSPDSRGRLCRKGLSRYGQDAGGKNSRAFKFE